MEFFYPHNLNIFCIQKEKGILFNILQKIGAKSIKKWTNNVYKNVYFPQNLHKYKNYEKILKKFSINFENMWIESGSSYNPEDAIQSIIDNWTPPKFEEWSTSQACIEDSQESNYSWDSDFEPILVPTFDENGNQTWFDVPEEEDPDNLCPTQEEIDKMYD